jgi:hypothetical protein
MFRDRLRERRQGGAEHYRMRQKLVSIGDDYWIENDRGERVYKVDGKAPVVMLAVTVVLDEMAHPDR